MKKPKNITIKTGSVDEFFKNVRKTMHAIDKKKSIDPSHTLTFEDPLDMLHFLSATKLKLIATIQKHPDTITNIAKATHRHRSSVSRDITEMERFGLVKTRKAINPGHGWHKIVELSAPHLKLEAHI
jgi:predicted transcriptional regulator